MRTGEAHIEYSLRSTRPRDLVSARRETTAWGVRSPPLCFDYGNQLATQRVFDPSIPGQDHAIRRRHESVDVAIRRDNMPVERLRGRGLGYSTNIRQ